MIIVAVGILLRRDSSSTPSVLLCQRKASSRYGLKWEFPGGKVEPREDLITGLKRELREELCIHAEVGKLFHSQHHRYADAGSFAVSYYLIPSFTGEIKNHVFEQCRWVNLDRLGDFDILEGNREVVQKLVETYVTTPSQTA